MRAKQKIVFLISGFVWGCLPVAAQTGASCPGSEAGPAALVRMELARSTITPLRIATNCSHARSQKYADSYLAYLAKHIRRHWPPSKACIGCENKKVILAFRIHEEGAMSALRVASSSGLAMADNAALSAVEASAPFHPLRHDWTESVDVLFIFDKELFDGGARKSKRPGKR